MIRFLGIICFCLIASEAISTLNASTPDDPYSIWRTNVFKNYWSIYWIQPLIYVVLSQILWFSKINKNVIIRIIIGLLFLTTIQDYIVKVTALHRDYLPSSWSVSIYDWLTEVVISLVLFLCFLLPFHFIMKLLMNGKSKKIS